MDYPVNEEKNLDLTLAKVAQDHFQETKENQKIISLEERRVKEDLANLVMAKSCSTEEIPIAGETYVSKDPVKKESYLGRIKQGLLIATAVLAIAGATYLGNTLQTAGDYRKEISQSEWNRDAIGGERYQDFQYDDQFVNYVKDLSDLELVDWANDTKKEMQEAGLETNEISSVAEKMQATYLENIAKKGEK